MAEKKRRGPYKFTKRKQNQYLALRSQGIGPWKAAEEVGMSRVGIWQFAQDHPDFKAAEEAACETATDDVVNALWESAASGNVRACEYWLNNRRPDEWKDKKSVDQQVSGPGGKPIEVINTANLTHDEKKQMLELIRKTRRDDETTADPNRDPAEP